MFALHQVAPRLHQIALSVPPGVPPPWGAPPNVYLLRGSRPVLVDTGLPGSGDRLAAALREAQVDPSEVAAVVLTSARPEAIGNLDAFPNARRVVALAGEVPGWRARAAARVERVALTLAQLLEGPSIPRIWSRVEADEFLRGWGAIPACLDAPEAVLDGAELDLGDTRLCAFSTPGVDAGAACWLDVDRGWLFGGSTLDLSPGPMIEDPGAHENSLRSVFRTTPSLVLPAHGLPHASYRLLFRSIGLHSGSALAQLPWAFEGGTSAVQLAHNDIGGYPRSVVRFAAHVERFRAMLDALVQAGILLCDDPASVWSIATASEPKASRSFRGILRAR